MSGYKLRKTFGLICLAVAGLLLLKEISGLAAPGVAEMAKKDFGEHLRDLLICFAIGGSGLYLYRDKTSDPSLFIWKLNIFALVLTPLLNIQIAPKLTQEYGLLASFSEIRPLLIGISLFLLIIPYVFGKNIVVYQSRRRSTLPSITPELALYFIGLGCALLPSTTALFSVLAGLPAGDIVYFSGLSYSAAAIWSGWWYRRYSRPARESPL